jgi:type II secretory pathway predicted ATPase ExeA
MYETFFGLSRKPFSKTPDPGYFFLSRIHEEALARLHYAIEEKELIMLTGEVGSGKTTLTRVLMDSLGPNCRVILILNPRLTPVQFLRTVAKRLGIERPGSTKNSILDMLYEKVYADYEAGITPVVIIDEAQLVPHRNTFEEIRLLTNFQLDDTNLLSLVLVGQTDLRKKLLHDAYLPLRQRIGFFYHLGPLPEHETKGYVEHRLKVAGLGRQLFSDEAIHLLHHYSGGIPRLINSLASASLLEAFGRESDSINGSFVQEAAKELMLDGPGKN